jgi:hypothetical protein
MTKRLISAGLVALTAGTLWSLARQLQRRGRFDVPKPKPVQEQTWEGEGGALPATGAQMGPDPAVTSAAPEGSTVPPAVH